MLTMTFFYPDYYEQNMTRGNNRVEPRFEQNPARRLFDIFPLIFNDEKSFIDRKNDDTIVIHVGDSTRPEDVTVELSPDARTLAITVDTSDEDNGTTRYLKHSYRGDRKFDFEELSAELNDGNLVVTAPYVHEDDEDNSRTTQGITIKHTPEIAPHDSGDDKGKDEPQGDSNEG